jgi:hypothetical protein
MCERFFETFGSGTLLEDEAGTLSVRIRTLAGIDRARRRRM